MSIKSQGGVFGRNPTFNDVTVEGDLSVGGSNVVVDSDIGSTVQSYDADTAKLDTAQTWSANQTLSDNIEARFGDDADLRIYHNGTTSWVRNFGTGSLYIAGDSDGDVIIQGKAGQNSVACYDDGATSLYYSGSTRLATSSTGISVTGNVAVPSGNGIDFSATSGTGTSELFDDYEEGTFNSSTMNFETSGSATLNQYLLGYTKVGNLVTCTGNLWVNTVTSQSGPLKIDLPFTASSGTENRSIGYVGLYDSTLTAIVKIEPSATYATVVTPYLWGTHTVSNGNTLVVSFSYHTDS